MSPKTSRRLRHRILVERFPPTVRAPTTVGAATNSSLVAPSKAADCLERFPTLAVNGPDDTGQGRWIPTTSVDEFSATLATWFGVSSSDLPTVLPNIGRFAHPNLGIFG